MSTYQFKLPDIGEGIVEAELLEWRVEEGDVVREDEVIAELMTDKATIEIPSPRAGTIQRLCFAPGDTVPVGATLIEIEEEGTAPLETSPPSRDHTPAAEPTTPPAEPTAPTVPAARAAPLRERETARGAITREHHPPRMPARPGARTERRRTAPSQRVEAVPAVRELARRLGVDIEDVFGTGPGGRIMRRDVERHLELSGRALPDGFLNAPRPGEKGFTTPEDPDDWERVPLRGIRRLIAERMHRSKSTAAHFTYVEEVDMTEIERKRRDAAGSPESELSPLAYIAAAVVKELPRFPLLNASLDDVREEIILKKRIHLGMATATDEGLLVPVIRDAQDLSILELAEAIRTVAEGARHRTLPPDALTGSTFTISSLGKLGGILATPIINHPETAILSVHAMRELPRYISGELVPRSILNLAISLDHRVIDGIDCARFIQRVKKRLEAADVSGPREESNGD